MLQLLSLSVLAVVIQPALSSYNCSSLYNRVPDNSDLRVDCGVSVITLEVNACTAQWAGFNPGNLSLNGQHNNSLCKGTIDTSVDPPVIHYQLPVNDSHGNPCRESMLIKTEVPSASGPFNQFSSIQSVIISGYIDTPSSSVGVVSYATDLFYRFTCRYPLEYLINNTEIVASSVSVATKERNGSFIDTLSMSVYNDTTFSHSLDVPSNGLQLRTKVYVEVKSVNLSGNFNLLLDHCFATPSPYNLTNREKHDFFTVVATTGVYPEALAEVVFRLTVAVYPSVGDGMAVVRAGCTADSKVSVLNNGRSKNARFSFEAFRFVEHRDREKSSIFLHCILRLCEPDKCQNILNGCNRGKRAVDVESGEPTTATVTMGPLYTAAMTSDSTPAAYVGGTKESNKAHDNVSGVVLGAIFASAGALMLVLAGWFTMKKFC